jgi:hypothetical protein
VRINPYLPLLSFSSLHTIDECCFWRKEGTSAGRGFSNPNPFSKFGFSRPNEERLPALCFAPVNLEPL